MPCAVILTALSVEFLAVRAYLTDIQEKTHPQGTIYEQGKFIDDDAIWDVGIVEIGAGNTGAALEVERAISYFNPDIILFVGVAGGIKDVELGDVVASTKIYSYASGKTEATFETRPEVGLSAYDLEQRARATVRSWLLKAQDSESNPHPKAFVAPIAAGEKVIASTQSNVFKFLRKNYGDAIAVEMEGFGFLDAARANQKVSALVIRGISDLIYNKMEADQLGYQNIAAQNASAFAFETLSKYKPDKSRGSSKAKEVSPASINSNELLAGIGQRIESAISNAASNLTGEQNKRIDHAKALINQGDFSQAVRYLEELKEDLWSRIDDKLKYYLLTNLGMASLGLDKINDAAANFIGALQYNPTDDQAIAYAAMGYVFQRDNAGAKKYIEEALQKNPANTLAHSLHARIVPLSESIESVVDVIPAAYRENIDVLVALGEAALNRKLYAKAEEWWEIALNGNSDRSMNSVKASLGFVLLKPISQSYSVIAAGQLTDSQKQILERAITLFTEVLGGEYVNPTNLSHIRFSALSNRANALRLLGRHDEAMRDIEIALQYSSEDVNVIKQRALLANDKGDQESAYTHIQKILFSPEVPEASILAAQMLIDLRRTDEAKDLLNQFLQSSDCSTEIKLEAKHLKFELLLNLNDRGEAETTLREINSEAPNDVFTFIQKIRWQKYIESESGIPELVQRAKSALFLSAPTHAKIILPDVLYRLGYYRDAAEIYEQFVDKSLNTPLVRQLLQAYYYAGNYKNTLILCKQLLDKYGPLKTVSEIAAYIYDDVGDMDAVREVSEAYLNIFPTDVRMQLRLAAANYATGENEKLDLFLDSKPSIEELDLKSLKKLAQLYKVTRRIDLFLDLIYEIRRRFYDDGQVHAFYQISYLEASKIKSEAHDLSAVTDGCGILLRNTFDKETWWIYEDRPDASFSRNEINSNNSLYQALMGKGVGEKVGESGNDFSSTSFTIAAIVDKYFAAGKQSFSVLENQIGIKNFKMMPVEMEDGKLSEVWKDSFFEQLKQYQDNFENIKSKYISGEFPLGAAAILLNRNPIEFWQVMISEASPFIHAWSDFENENFEGALTVLQKGGIIVIDPISLLTLHHLGVADDVMSVLGEFGISQSTIDLFQGIVEIAGGLNSQGLSSIGVEEGKLVLQNLSSEQVSQQKIFFERIINWARSNCRVLPCNKALDINKEQRDDLRKYIGSAFIDTALIASEAGRILYSDDQWLRWYARVDLGVRGVWTQTVLNHCLTQRNLNEPAHQKATLKLAANGYAYTVINSETLMAGAKLADWQPQPVYTSALKALSNEKNTNLNYCVGIAADFLKRLYLENSLILEQFVDPRNSLVFEMLKIISKNHSKTHFAKKMIDAVEQKFKVVPVQKKEVIGVIKVWVSSQTIIT